jgi:hypothetical protein
VQDGLDLVGMLLDDSLRVDAAITISTRNHFAAVKVIERG